MVKKIQNILFSWLLKFFLNFIFLTTKIKPIEDGVFLSLIDSRPILVSVWHHHGMLLAAYFKNNKIPIWTVSSTHPDSEILAKVLLSWNIKLIRGSSTRGWFNVVKHMISLYKHNDSVVVITPDGPRGPRKKAKMGSFNVANKCGAKIFSVSATASNFWTLPSWDKTIIPKPFSTIYVRFSLVSETSKITRHIIEKHMENNKTSLINCINKND